MIAGVVVRRFRSGESFVIPDGVLALTVAVDDDDVERVTVAYLEPR